MTRFFSAAFNFNFAPPLAQMSLAQISSGASRVNRFSSPVSSSTVSRFSLTVVLLIMVFATAACSSYEPKNAIALAADVNEANLIISKLEEGNIEVVKESSAEPGKPEVYIFVKQKWFGSNAEAEKRARQILRENGLPRAKSNVTDAATGAMGVTNASKQQEQLRAIRQAELRQMILDTYQNLVTANVVIVPAETNTLPINRRPASATVSVVIKPNTTPPSKESLQSLIARGVEALDPKNVNVEIATYDDLTSGATGVSGISNATNATVANSKSAAPSRTRTALIVALLGGGTILLATLGLMFFLHLRNSRQRAQQEDEDDLTGATAALMTNADAETFLKEETASTATAAASPSSSATAAAEVK